MDTLASRVAALYMQRTAAPKLVDAFVAQVGTPQGWNVSKLDAHFRKALAQLLGEKPEYSAPKFAGAVYAELEGDRGTVDVDAPEELTLVYASEFKAKELAKALEASAPPFFKQKEPEITAFWTNPRNANMVEAYIRDVWRQTSPSLLSNDALDGLWEAFRDDANSRYLNYYTKVIFAGANFDAGDVTIQSGKFTVKGKLTIDFDNDSFQQTHFDDKGYADSQV